MERRLRFIFLLGGIFVGLHLILSLFAGMSVDEAHYALYGYRLDWSYFDHPPLIGWLQAPAVYLFKGSDFALRLAPFLCWIATIVLLRRLTKEFFPGPEQALRADISTFLILAAPMFHILGMGLLPDSALLPIACLVMGATWRLLDPAAAGRVRPWIGLGAWVGLAGLAKYTGIFLAVSSGAVLFGRFGWRLFLSRGPWIAAGLSLLLISPVLIWNAEHDWISFAFQVRHAAGQEWNDIGGVKQFFGSKKPPDPPPEHAWNWRLVIVFGLVQAIVYGPLFILGAIRGWRKAAEGPVERSAAFLCLAFALPPIAVVTAFAGHGSLPHWTGFGWVAAAPLAAAGLARAWEEGKNRGWMRWFGRGQLALCAAAFLLAMVGGPAMGSGIQPNPFADLYGWDRAAVRARALAAECHVDSLSVCNWTLASRLGWYARPATVHVLDRRIDQFTLWYGKLRPGESTVVVDWSAMSYALPVAPAEPGGFRECRYLGSLPVERFGRVISRFDFYLCRDWGGGAYPTRR